MPGSVRVARILGIDIRIHFSWIVIFLLFVLQLSDLVLPADFPTWSKQKTFVVAVVTAFLFFASVLAHELAHSLVARRFKMSVSSITLFLLGGVANLTKEPPSARAEFLMAAAGPGTSIVIGIAGLAIGQVASDLTGTAPLLEPIGAVARTLGEINLLVAGFNLIPGFPLDGGRVLRSLIWGFRSDRAGATRIAARGGQMVAALLFLLGVALSTGFLGPADFGRGIWYWLIAYVLYNAASQTLQQERLSSRVGDARVGQLMTTEFRAAQSGMTVGALIRDLVPPNDLRSLAVTNGGRMVGLVAVADLRKVDQEMWSMTRVDEVMTPASAVASVTPEDRLATAMVRFEGSGQALLPVLRDETLVGLLYRESLAGYLRMREMMGVDSRS